MMDDTLIRLAPPNGETQKTEPEGAPVFCIKDKLEWIIINLWDRPYQLSDREWFVIDDWRSWRTNRAQSYLTPFSILKNGRNLSVVKFLCYY